MSDPKIQSAILDQVARHALNGILAQSIEKRWEYGGMIYVLRGGCHAMPPRTQQDPNKVDVGQHERNCSCPPGSTPIAYYHTHPIYSIAGMKASYNEFSPEDIDVLRDYNLDVAYLGTLDGSFYKYDRKLARPVLLPGRLKNTK